jgi:hypothetical protein
MPRLQDIYQALYSQQIVISPFLFSLQFITFHYIFLDYSSAKSLNFSKIRGWWAGLPPEFRRFDKKLAGIWSKDGEI